VPKDRQEELLNEFEGSGISAMRFAKLAGVNYATFANWRQKRRKARAQDQGSGAEQTLHSEGVGVGRPVRLFEAFAEVGRSAAPGRNGLLIELVGGAQMVVESPMQLRMAAELIGMLDQNTRRSC
jgi:hypothetical protein